jgi:hypothetical protein
MQARSDQSISGNYKPSADTLLIVVSTELSQHHNRISDLLGQSFGVERLH